MTFAVKTAGDPLSLTSSVRGALNGLDRELPVFDTQTMEQRMEKSLVSRKSPVLLSLSFGAVALFLSAIGIYGVLAYLVTQRRREIGIRIALGSSARAIFELVLREGLLLIAGGFVLGAIGAIALRKSLESQLFGVSAADPLVLVAVTAILAARRGGRLRAAGAAARRGSIRSSRCPNSPFRRKEPSMISDLRVGLRLLWRDKAFSLTAALTLALCIGANTALFSVVHNVLLRPLPVPESDRIVLMGNAYPGAGAGGRRRRQLGRPRLLRSPARDRRVRGAGALQQRQPERRPERHAGARPGDERHAVFFPLLRIASDAGPHFLRRRRRGRQREEGRPQLRAVAVAVRRRPRSRSARTSASTASRSRSSA